MVNVQRLCAKTNLKVPVCRTYRTITQKRLQLELPTENSVYSQENRNRAENYAHLTSENEMCIRDSTRFAVCAVVCDLSLKADTHFRE